MLKTIIPESKAKIQKQIDALEYVLRQDTREKDIEVHQQAIDALKEGLKALEEVENAPSPAGRKKTIDVKLIKKLRNDGMTQEQVARELNISTSSVRRNEK